MLRQTVTLATAILSSQSGRLWLLLTLSVCLSVSLSVCPAFTAYISVTLGRILIKLGGTVGTLVRLIVLKFEHSAAKGKTLIRGKIYLNFYAFQSISSRLRHTLFLKISRGNNSVQRGKNYM